MGHKLDFSNFSLFLRIRAKNSQFIEKRDFNFYSFRFSFGFATKPCECRRAGRLPPYPALHTSAFIKVFHGIARRAARVICLITMLTSSHTITSFSSDLGKGIRHLSATGCHFAMSPSSIFLIRIVGVQFLMGGIA